MAFEADFDRFVRARGPRLLRAGWLLTGEFAAAEDLVQTALERVWPKWEHLRDDGERLAYVHRVMTNTFLRGRRRRWIGELPTESLPEIAGADESDRLVLQGTVLAAIRRLPRRQRTVIALRYLADLSEAQTATAMGCRPGSVKSYTFRALATLRADAALSDLFVEEPSRD